MNPLIPDPFLTAAHGFRALGVVLVIWLAVVLLASIPAWLRRRRDERAARKLLAELDRGRRETGEGRQASDCPSSLLPPPSYPRSRAFRPPPLAARPPASALRPTAAGPRLRRTI